MFFKKIYPSLLIGAILLFYAWLVQSALQTNLPEAKHPLLFYSNQTRHDIKQTFHSALSKAEHSIFLSFYGISDPQLIGLLAKRSLEEVKVTVEYDPSATKNLKKLLPPPAEVHPIKAKGLMHNKIIVIDHAQVFLGSANLTTTSLRHHANLVLGIYSPELAIFLENPSSSHLSFLLDGQRGEIHLLPDPDKRGITELYAALGRAEKKIYIAMFTLTHPEICTALIQAKQRGVDVQVAVDYYTAKGASKKFLSILREEGIPVHLSQGKELLHHKWALIDETTLIMGSANWTKAAFSKNRDFLLFLNPLQVKQVSFLTSLWEIITSEAAS